MPNRAERRRTERAHNKAIKNRGGPPPPERPTNESHGVDVQQGDDGFVYLTFFLGYATFVVKWTKDDAHIIGNMIVEAAGDDKIVEKEVVRQSGLVVPPSDFKL